MVYATCMVYGVCNAVLYSCKTVDIIYKLKSVTVLLPNHEHLWICPFFIPVIYAKVQQNNVPECSLHTVVKFYAIVW